MASEASDTTLDSEMLNHRELIDQFFKYLSYLGNPESTIDAVSIRKYLNEGCIIQSNNQMISQGIEGFLNLYYKMQQKYEKVSYSNLLEDPIICGDKAVLHFHVHCLNREGTQRDLDAIAILTFQNRKISMWKEVFQDIER